MTIETKDVRFERITPIAPTTGAGFAEQGPTEAMLNAARDWSRVKYGMPIGNDAAIGCWKAMAAAIPSAPSPTPASEREVEALDASLLEEAWGALNFILAFYEPGQRHLDTNAWTQAEASGRRIHAKLRAALDALRSRPALAADPTKDLSAQERGIRLRNKLSDKQYREAFVQAHTRQFLAAQLRAFRGDLSQEEMGDKLGMPQSVVCRLEDPSYGRFALSTLLEIAGKLDKALSVRFVDFETFVELSLDVGDAAQNPPSFEELGTTASPGTVGKEGQAQTGAGLAEFEAALKVFERAAGAAYHPTAIIVTEEFNERRQAVVELFLAALRAYEAHGEAVEAEREACAKIAASYGEKNRFGVSDTRRDDMTPAQVYETAAIDISAWIESEIRARAILAKLDASQGAEGE